MSIEFQGIDENKKQFADHYECNYSCLSKAILLSQTMGQLLDTKQKIENYKDDQQKKGHLQIHEVKNIKHEDSSIYLGERFADYLNKIRSDKQSSVIQVKDIFGMIVTVLQPQIIATLLFYMGEVLFKLVLSVILQLLFENVQAGNKQRAYVLALGAGLTYFISQVNRHNGFYRAPIIGAKLRAGLVFLLFSKLSSLSQYIVKKSQIFKITNMISSDFNVIQLKTPMFFSALVSPFTCIGVIIVLITRLGWAGVFGILIPLASFPLQVYIGKKNSMVLQKVNKHKDLRVKITMEIIEGIKFVKLYGWQLAFKKTIQKLRTLQLQQYFWLNFGRSIERAVGNVIALWASLLMFIIEHYTTNRLTTAIIFSTLQIMAFLKLNIFFLGTGIGLYYELNVIFERYANILNIKNIQMIQIDEFTKKPMSQNKNQQNLEFPNQSLYQLNSDDSMVTINLKGNGLINNQEKQINFENLQNGEILLKNFNGYWSTDQIIKPSLNNINIHFEKGKFYGICGKIGSGKSGLLGAILNQIPYYSGIFLKKGSLVYVEQESILFSATVRQNILFGKPFDQRKYDLSIKNSCLSSDLQILEHGDQTIVGQRGITLSGGQKARLTLARALYYDGDIYLLDDPLSAVDSKVAKQIYERVIVNLSKTKTIILVTHQINYLLQCDRVIIMSNGSIIHQDSPQNLKQQLQLLSLTQKKQQTQDQSQQKIDQIFQQDLNTKIKENQNRLQIDFLKVRRRKASVALSQISKSEAMVIQIKPINQEENVRVTAETYSGYVLYNQRNKILFTITILFFIASEAINTLYMRLLAEFGHIKDKSNDLFGDNFDIYWSVLIITQFFYFIFLFIKYFLLSLVIIENNEKIHETMIHSLVRCPSSYFDTISTGKLANKFSNDLGVLDDTLLFVAFDVLEGPFVSIVMIANIFQINLYFIPEGIAIIIFLVFFFSYCKPPILCSKQLDLRTKTPVFNVFTQTISGLVQIRIYNRRKALLKQFSNLVNNMTRSNICFWNISRAFGVYVNYFSIVISMTGFFVGIYNSTIQTAGLYSLSILFLIQLNQYTQWFLRQIMVMESIMVSVERIKLIIDEKHQKELRTEYDREVGLQHEVNQHQKLLNNQPLTQSIELSWPEKAIIEFKNVSMRYREGLPLVLKNVSFKINQAQKVGIVGRTGAGKSSIIQAIFRICELEPTSEYIIDNFDAQKMGLHSLRQHISVIPQLPFIFKGSIKENVDPLSLRSDQQIWEALQESGLFQCVNQMQSKLQTQISNSSEFLSVGQKQLLCLARALLRKSNKFLVLDQATSNVDMKTDDLIQRVLKTKFKETTIIAIAHRLNTIADYDKIIVMSKGRVAEIGEPYELILKGKYFFEMVNHTGTNAENIIKIAKSSYEKRRSLEDMVMNEGW